jgi:hypothetical protein
VPESGNLVTAHLSGAMNTSDKITSRDIGHYADKLQSFRNQTTKI